MDEFDREFAEFDPTAPAPTWFILLNIVVGTAMMVIIMSAGDHPKAASPYGELRRDAPPVSGCQPTR